MRRPSQALDIRDDHEYDACTPNGAMMTFVYPKLITSMANDLETERFRRGGPSAARGRGGFGGRGFRRGALAVSARRGWFRRGG
jgi:hypothetical protein